MVIFNSKSLVNTQKMIIFALSNKKSYEIYGKRKGAYRGS